MTSGSWLCVGFGGWVVGFYLLALLDFALGGNGHGMAWHGMVWRLGGDWEGSLQCWEPLEFLDWSCLLNDIPQWFIVLFLVIIHAHGRSHGLGWI